MTTWTDCLVMLQQGQVDAISTDDAVLSGLDEAGPHRGGGRRRAWAWSPTASASRRSNDDLVRFVNGVLEQMRDDGTWQRLYDRWLLGLGPSPGPPAARYQD